MDYPFGIDYAWIASDRDGRLGAFITAGSAPIPVEVFATDFSEATSIEAPIDEVPIVSKANLLVPVKDASSYIALAERGFYVFDWTDIHRVARAEIHAYELVAKPERPAGLSSLPPDLASIAAGIQFWADFGSTAHFDVRTYKKCVEAERP
ncbi:MAG: hypothetical protein E5W56_02145 [Mesorhizobium sp.]|nr:MAG: hypothetical protein E5W57_25820 [Mesorhizobium sp.]TIT83482.1 MAG: hypothetical protein E5W56_02145 [Mesorhizobium sp.]